MNRQYQTAAALLLAFCLGSCSNPQATEPTQLARDSFFPLAVGNVWYYSSYSYGTMADTSKFDERKEVISHKYLGNKDFYLLFDSYYNTDGSVRAIDSLYYSLYDDTLLIIHANTPFTDSSISLARIFPPTASDSFRFGDGYEGSLVSQSDSIVVYSFWKPDWMDSGWNETYKKNIGMIDTHSGWGIGSMLVKYYLKH